MTHASCSTSKFPLPLLALDVGKKRIGIAVSDSLGISTRGIACLHRNDKQWPQQTLKLIQEYGCLGIVIGVARNMDGSEGVQAKDCRSAAKELGKQTPLPIFFQDERLSSWTAKERLFAQGLSEKKVIEKLDQTAAAVILEDYIAHQKTIHQAATEKTPQTHKAEHRHE
ncbi:MAG: Holliday junction resolvase RuvX [Zetaproteobacteria bacterium]|nr:Holliday junction resolvase RuvX [Zetaproteobacteria bacterium]